jgi:hypothetical protein
MTDKPSKRPRDPSVMTEHLVRCFSVECTVRSGEVVELLPFGEPSSKVAVVGVGEELIELLLIGSMRALNLAVKLRRSGFDIGMANGAELVLSAVLGLPTLDPEPTSATAPNRAKIADFRPITILANLERVVS